VIDDVAERQSDVDEKILGPPTRVGFDKEGKPTQAALAFAKKNHIEVDAISRVTTDKGEYLAAQRQETGKATQELLPDLLEAVFRALSFKKSMRWGGGSLAFGRPVRWLLGLYGAAPVKLEVEGIPSGAQSQGHRFLSKQPFKVESPKSYTEQLKAHHVLVDPEERKQTMLSALRAAAGKLNGELIEDAFLVEENLNLVETPHVLTGSFERRFLELPERVILDVAKDHQRYFGVRDADNKLMPNYLAVAGTAENPENIVRGNDRVMRARLADAEFFYKEDLKRPLAERLSELDGIVFHKRLGSVGEKVRRISALLPALGEALGLKSSVIEDAKQAALLAKCDLVTLMVGEFPELQGDMGRSYALKQGASLEVASAIFEHYQPRGADDDTAPSEPGALLAIADRLDTLTGCFAVGLAPTGNADPLALRRAALGVLKTLLDRAWDLELPALIVKAHAGFSGTKLDLDASGTTQRLGDFFRDRLKKVLTAPQDVIDACLAAGHKNPNDVRARANALGAIDAERRALVGEVFKRAANIAKDAPSGLPKAPGEVEAEPHPSELALFEALSKLEGSLTTAAQDYPAALGAIASFAPTLAKFFEDVFVMADDQTIRDNRLRLMQRVQDLCGSLANFKLLG
jgi:glycyl-tRNA synthetase beta chain